MADGPRAVILAAGNGTRMRSARPKVLHALGGRSLIDYSVELATEVCGRRPLVVVSPLQPAVAAHLDGCADVVIQPQPLGTGDAVRAVPAAFRKPGPVLVLNADVPLLRRETVDRLIDAAMGHACALLTVKDVEKRGLGRVYRNAVGDVECIVEERDLVDGAVVPDECNAGSYVFDGSRLWPAIERLTRDNVQGEYYLTDVVALLDGPVAAVLTSDPGETLGINDRRQLAAAEAELRRRTLDRLMLAGVTIEDPATTYIDALVEIGEDSVVHPMIVVRGATHLGRECEIGPMAQLTDVRGGDRLHIGASVLEACELGDDVVIGHFDRVRPHSRLHSRVSLGTHAEVKNSTLGTGSRVGHFACVLDSDIGQDVNIGAGAVTCNYDGAVKHRIAVEDGVFVGTNATLVAPLRLGAGSYVAAGSLVNQDVPAGALAVGRARQRNIEDWAVRRRRGDRG